MSPEELEKIKQKAKFLQILEDTENLNNTVIPFIESKDFINVTEETKEKVIENIQKTVSEADDLVELVDGSFISYRNNSHKLILCEHSDKYVYSNRAVRCIIDINYRYEDWEDKDNVIQVLDLIDENDEDYDIDDDEYIINVSKNLIKELIKSEDNKLFINTTAAIQRGYELINNKWCIVKIVNVEELPYYEQLKNSLNLFYPNKWWFQKNSDTKFLSIPSNVSTIYRYCLIIKFPEVTISNSYNKSHLIRDLYVVLFFNEKSSYTGLYGFRETFTNIERGKNYSHSHLPGALFNQLLKFCTGRDTIVQILIRLNENFTKNNFESLLAILNIYVAWESLEGGPHNKIQYLNLRNEINKDYVNSLWSHSYEESEKLFKSLIKNIKFKIFLDQDGYFNVDFDSLEKQLTETTYSDGVFNKNNYSYMYKDEVGNYYTLNNHNISNKLEVASSPICILGGKPIIQKTILTEVNAVPEEKFINVQITNHVRKELTKRINDYYFSKKQNREAC